MPRSALDRASAAETPWLPGRGTADAMLGTPSMRKPRIATVLFAALLLAAAAACSVPHAVEGVLNLDDPSRAALRALDGTFDTAVAHREIEAALSAQDAELAQSFVELAAARNVQVDPALMERTAAATADAASMRHRVTSFAQGFVTGEPQDVASFAGAALGDLFVFGDIRDALREGVRYVRGEQVDELVLGLAAAGIAVTAGTYATAGAGAPARAGLTLVKTARKSGRLSAEFAENLGRMVKQASFPALSRGTREGMKIERANGLLHLVRDAGRIEKAAGGRAALDALKLAKEPRDITRIAKLAEKEGSRTRAILKIAGRGAIALAVLTFDVAGWILGAILAVFGFVSALKSAVERTTLHIVRRRRERRAARWPIAAVPVRG